MKTIRLLVLVLLLFPLATHSQRKKNKTTEPSGRRGPGLFVDSQKQRLLLIKIFFTSHRETLSFIAKRQRSQNTPLFSIKPNAGFEHASSFLPQQRFTK